MKRFFAIFGICLASLVAVVGGVFGVKFLKGDFNPQAINPDSISFELEEYRVVNNFYITLTTPTENVTETKVTLSFAKGISYSPFGANKITDGVVIIPNQAELNVPFEVQLYTKKDDETNGLDWIAGGISKIIATSNSSLHPFDEATICVDVPVYKTDLVVLNNYKNSTQNSLNFFNEFKYVENSNYAKTLSDSTFNAGDTVYFGLKYTPTRSAYKYSQMSSSNMFVEYQQQIQAKIQELGLNYNSQINQLNTLLSSNNVNINEIMLTYSQIINTSITQSSNNNLVQFSEYLKNLNTQFKDNFKYYTFQESTNYFNFDNLEQVDGTNLYKLQVTSDSAKFLNSESVESNLYSYTFYNSEIESATKIETATTGENLLTVLENLYNKQGNLMANKKVDKCSASLTLTDVDVDTIETSGNISNFYTNKVHTIYACQNGTNSELESFLNISLSNSNASMVNLQNKIEFLGIRFEKSNGEEANIKFLDEANYTQITHNNKTYYLPIFASGSINSAYWQVYSDVYDSSNTTPIFAYFKKGSNDNGSVIEYEPTITFNLRDAAENESLVAWKSNQDLSLGVIDLKGIVNMDSSDDSTTDYTYYKEIDLSTLINIPETNKFQDYKFFLYSDNMDTSNPISNFFETKDGKTYYINGIQKNLFELDGNVLKLKNANQPTYSIKVIFATIKTSAEGPAIKNADGTYQFVKFSAVKETSIENLFALNVIFPYSNISKIEGTLSISENNKAGIKENALHVAQNTSNVLKIELTETNLTAVQNEIEEGNITVVAYKNKTDNISYVTATFDHNKTFNISTKSLSLFGNTDTDVKFYFAYTIDNKTFLFPISLTNKTIKDSNGETIKDSNNTDITLNSDNVKIVKNVESSASFAFEHADEFEFADIDHIKVSISYASETFTKTFTAVLKNNSEKPITIMDSDNNNQVLVSVKNFLGVEMTDGAWFLQSSNTTVATISDNKTINFVGNGDVTISLFLGDENNNQKQQEIKFKFDAPGYVSSVTKYDEKTKDQASVYTYDKDSPYKFSDISVELTGNTISVNNFGLNELVKMNYTLNNSSATTTDDEIPLNFTIKLKDADSADKFNAIQDSQTMFEAGSIVTTLTLGKNLGEDVVINLLFMHEELGLTQNVKLTLKATIKISDFKIEYTTIDSNINPKTETVSEENGTYTVYAGVTYTVTFTPSSDDYWNYKDDKGILGSGYTSITNNSFTFAFPDYSPTDSTLTISNSSDPTYGDVKYNTILKVEPNIYVNQNIPQKELSGNSVTINLFDDIFFRRVNNYDSSYAISNSIWGGLILEFIDNFNDNKKISSYTITSSNKTTTGSTTTDTNGNKTITTSTSDYSGKDKQKLTLTFNSFTDSITIGFKIKCTDNATYSTILGGSGNNQGAITLKIDPQNLQKTENFALYNGDKAIVLTNGSEISQGIFEEMFNLADSSTPSTPSATASTGAGTDGGNGGTNNGTVAITYYSDKTKDIGTFLSSFATYDGTNKYTITSSTTDLFVNTGYIATVTKDGISETYKIIISELDFPFVNFVDNEDETLSYSNLDIYKLFVSCDNLVGYYSQAGISYFTVDNNLTLTLAANSATSNIFILKRKSTEINNINMDSGYSVQLADGSLATNYAELNNQNSELQLKTNHVGQDTYLKVLVSLCRASQTSYCKIPIIVKLAKNQTLDVNYPNSNQTVASGAEISEKIYGSDEYDKIYLGSEIIPFENDKMEYLTFNNITSTASLELFSTKLPRFIVKNNGVVDAEFSQNMLDVSIVKIYINQGGIWSQVSTNSFDNYAKIVNNTLQITKGNADVVRVKLAVSTPTKATNFYYVSAGESSSIQLYYKTQTSSELPVGTNHTLNNVNYGDLIVIGSIDSPASGTNSDNSNKYYFFIKNNSDKLFYRVIDKDGNVFVVKTTTGQTPTSILECITTTGITCPVDLASGTSNQLEISLQPNGTTFTIEVFTQYGVLSTITVIVNPAFDFELKSSDIFAGTEYAIKFEPNSTTQAGGGLTQATSSGKGQGGAGTTPTQPDTDTLITITPTISDNTTLNGYEIDSISIDKITDSNGTEITVGDICTIDGTTTNILFNHQMQEIKCTLTLIVKFNDTISYTIITDEIKIKPRIVSTSTQITPATISTTETNGTIEITKDQITGLFKDEIATDKTFAPENFTQNNNQIKIWGYYDNKPYVGYNITNNCFKFDVGVLTTETVKDFIFVVEKSPDSSITQPNESNIIAKAYAKVTIAPEYQVTINYPYASESTKNLETCEFVISGTTINFNEQTFNGKNRIEVKQYNPDTREYGDFTNWSLKVGTIESTNQKSHTFNEVGDYKVEIIINNKTYNTYSVRVQTANPYQLETDGITTYVGYGDDSILNNVYLIVTLPTGLQNFSSPSNSTEEQKGDPKATKIEKIHYGELVSDPNTQKPTLNCPEAEGKNYIEIKKYYYSGQNIRAVVNINTYSIITKNGYKLYILDGETYKECEYNVEFSENNNGLQYSLTYNGKQVDYEFYSKIIGAKGLINAKNLVTNSSNPIEPNSDKINGCYGYAITNQTTSQNMNVSKINYLFDFKFEPQTNNEQTSVDSDGTITITLNANEFAEGVSFVEKFGLKDSLNQYQNFGINSLPAGTTISLTSDQVGAYSSLLYDPLMIDNIKYDFALKALGAKNDGTIVNLTFTYTCNGISKTVEETLKVKVISDVVETLRNSDGTDTANSAQNPLKITYAADKQITLASPTITNYIYTKGRYSTITTNTVVYWQEPTASGDTTYFSVYKNGDTNELIVKLIKNADFGNKKLTLTFTDSYGYTFNYYIELIATVNITATEISTGTFYEGDSIYVYNKNINNHSTANKGIAVTLLQADGTVDTSAEIYIAEVKFKYAGTIYDCSDDRNPVAEIDSNTNTNTSMNIKFLNEDLWGGTSQYTGTLIITIKGSTANDAETYTFSKELIITKRYASSFKAQNVYFRDTVPADLSHYISVHDNKIGQYLGEPELKQDAQVYANVDLSDINVTVDSESENLKNILDDKITKINQSSSETEITGIFNDLKKYGIAPYNGSTSKTIINLKNSSGTTIATIVTENGTTTYYSGSDTSGEALVATTSNNTTTLTKVGSTIAIIVSNNGTTTYYEGSSANNDNKLTEFKQYSITDFGVYYQVKAIRNTDEQTKTSIPFVAQIDYDSTNKATIAAELVFSQANWDDLINSTSSYKFEFYLYNITNQTAATKFASTNLTQEEEGSQTKATIGSLYGLELYAHQQTNVLIKVDGEEDPRTIEHNGVGLMPLTDSAYQGKNISLFTGKHGKDSDGNDILYVNGLSDATAKTAKNISSIVASGSSSYTPSLINASSLSEETKDGVTYKYASAAITDILIKYTVYNESDNQYKYAKTTISGGLRVTTKFTGIDTLKAYKGGTIYYHYDSSTALESDIILDDWAKDFKLVAGYGVSEIMSTGENKSFAVNVAKFDNNNIKTEQNGKIIFKPGNVKNLANSSSKSTSSTGLFTISQNGTIKLKSGFNIKEQYIAIEVYCLYGADTGTSYKQSKIGEIYVAFVEEEEVTPDIDDNEPTKLNIDVSSIITKLLPSTSAQSAEGVQPTALATQEASTDAGQPTDTTEPTLTKANFKLNGLAVESYENNSITIDNSNSNLEMGEVYNLTITYNNKTYISYIRLGSKIKSANTSKIEDLENDVVPIYVNFDGSSAIILKADLDSTESSTIFNNIQIVKYGLDEISTDNTKTIYFESDTGTTAGNIIITDKNKNLSNSTYDYIYINHYKIKIKVVKVNEIKFTSSTVTTTDPSIDNPVSTLSYSFSSDLKDVYTIDGKNYSIFISGDKMEIVKTPDTQENPTGNIDLKQINNSSTTYEIIYNNGKYEHSFGTNKPNDAWYSITYNGATTYLYIKN